MLRLTSFLVFIVVAVFVWWTITDNRDNKQTGENSNQHYLLLFMDEFKMTIMNQQGTLDYIVEGKRLERYKDSDDVLIQQVKLQRFENEWVDKSTPKKKWFVEAVSAKLNDKKSTIFLTKQVVLQQMASKKNKPLIIRTQNLHYNLKTKIAKTSEKVTIKQGKTWLKATGFIYNDIKQTIELNHKVTGEYFYE